MTPNEHPYEPLVTEVAGEIHSRRGDAAWTDHGIARAAVARLAKIDGVILPGWRDTPDLRARYDVLLPKGPYDGR